jgi:hypothetical protein
LTAGGASNKLLVCRVEDWLDPATIHRRGVFLFAFGINADKMVLTYHGDKRMSEKPKPEIDPDDVIEQGERWDGLS